MACTQSSVLQIMTPEIVATHLRPVTAQPVAQPLAQRTRALCPRRRNVFVFHNLRARRTVRHLNRVRVRRVTSILLLLLVHSC